VIWKWEFRKGKWTKVPYVADDPRRRADSTNSATWRPFGVALKSYLAGVCDGIGFVLGDGFVGLDLDDAEDPTSGEIAPWAQEIVAEIASYSEFSPTGTGIHILAKGSLPPRGRKKGPVEMYETGRYFTVTGIRVPGTPATIEDRTDALQRVHEKVFGVRGAKASSKSSRRQQSGPECYDPASQSDSDLLDRAKCAKNGEKFTNLWAGVWAAYPSQSEADLALCQMLAFWTNGDPERIDRLFRRSGLMREKWDEVHYAGGETYGQHTVALAVENLSAAASANVPDPIDRTDLGNATRFAAKYPHVRFDHVAEELVHLQERTPVGG
jgi:primase-polymerase (primpol)-like protein